MNDKKTTIWIILLFFTSCIVVALYLSTNLERDSSKVIHLGLDAQITDIDMENHILYVKDINEKVFIFGDRCAIDCTKAIKNYYLHYVNYNAQNDVRNIDFSEFKVGDEIIIGLSDKEKQNVRNKVAVAEQVQLSTQRMNKQE